MRPLNHLRFYDTNEFNGTSAVPNLQNHQLKPTRTKPKQLKVFGGTEIHTINNFISLTLSNYILNKIGFLYRCISCPICWVLTWSQRIYASPGSLWTSNAAWDSRGSAGATVPGLHPNSFPLCWGKLLIIQTVLPHQWSKIENGNTSHSRGCWWLLVGIVSTECFSPCLGHSVP